MSTLREHVDFELIRHLVMRAITCPVTGGSLDVRTCWVLRDADGDPIAVMAPGAYEQVPLDTRSLFATSGYTLDTRTA